MSDTASFPKREIKKPRKEKKCYFCSDLMPTGKRRYYYTGVWEGDFFSTHVCPVCHAFAESEEEVLEGEWDTFKGNREYEAFRNGIAAAKKYNL